MGCWLRSSSGETHAMRDGRGFHNPMLALMAEPQYFKNLSASKYVNDKDVEVVKVEDILADHALAAWVEDKKTGRPKKEYRAKLYKEVIAHEAAQRDSDKNLRKRSALYAQLNEIEANAKRLEANAQRDPNGAAAHKAKSSLAKAERLVAEIYEELERVEAALKLSGADLGEIDAIADIDAAAAAIDAMAAPKRNARIEPESVVIG